MYLFLVVKSFKKSTKSTLADINVPYVLEFHNNYCTQCKQPKFKGKKLTASHLYCMQWFGTAIHLLLNYNHNAMCFLSLWVGLDCCFWIFSHFFAGALIFFFWFFYLFIKCSNTFWYVRLIVFKNICFTANVISFNVKCPQRLFVSLFFPFGRSSLFIQNILKVMCCSFFLLLLKFSGC